MNKENARNRMNDYNEYAKSVNPRCIPVKGNSTGTWNRDFESRVKWILGNYRNNTLVSEKKGIDTTKKLNGKMVNIEIKCRCSTIGNYRSGKDDFPFLNSDIILYSMDYKPTETEREIANHTFVLETERFFEMLKELNLIRNNTARLEYQIQVFYTSKKRTNAFYNALCENALCMLSDLI